MPNDDDTALVRLAQLVKVGAHRRRAKSGKSESVKAYIRKDLDVRKDLGGGKTKSGAYSGASETPTITSAKRQHPYLFNSEAYKKGQEHGKTGKYSPGVSNGDGAHSYWYGEGRADALEGKDHSARHAKESQDKIKSAQENQASRAASDATRQAAAGKPTVDQVKSAPVGTSTSVKINMPRESNAAASSINDTGFAQKVGDNEWRATPPGLYGERTLTDEQVHKMVGASEKHTWNAPSSRYADDPQMKNTKGAAAVKTNTTETDRFDQIRAERKAARAKKAAGKPTITSAKASPTGGRAQPSLFDEEEPAKKPEPFKIDPPKKPAAPRKKAAPKSPAVPANRQLDKSPGAPVRNNADVGDRVVQTGLDGKPGKTFTVTKTKRSEGGFYAGSYELVGDDGSILKSDLSTRYKYAEPKSSDDKADATKAAPGFDAGDEVGVKVGGKMRVGKVESVNDRGQRVVSVPGEANVNRSTEDLWSSKDIPAATRAAEKRRTGSGATGAPKKTVGESLRDEGKKHPYPFNAAGYERGQSHGDDKYSPPQSGGPAESYWYGLGRADKIDGVDKSRVYRNADAIKSAETPATDKVEKYLKERGVVVPPKGGPATNKYAEMSDDALAGLKRQTFNMNDLRDIESEQAKRKGTGGATSAGKSGVVSAPGTGGRQNGVGGSSLDRKPSSTLAPRTTDDGGKANRLAGKAYALQDEKTRDRVSDQDLEDIIGSDSPTMDAKTKSSARKEQERRADVEAEGRLSGKTPEELAALKPKIEGSALKPHQKAAALRYIDSRSDEPVDSADEYTQREEAAQKRADETDARSTNDAKDAATSKSAADDAPDSVKWNPGEFRITGSTKVSSGKNFGKTLITVKDANGVEYGALVRGNPTRATTLRKNRNQPSSAPTPPTGGSSPTDELFGGRNNPKGAAAVKVNQGPPSTPDDALFGGRNNPKGAGAVKVNQGPGRSTASKDGSSAKESFDDILAAARAARKVTDAAQGYSNPNANDITQRTLKRELDDDGGLSVVDLVDRVFTGRQRANVLKQLKLLGYDVKGADASVGEKRNQETMRSLRLSADDDPWDQIELSDTDQVELSATDVTAAHVDRYLMLADGTLDPWAK